MSKEPNPTDGEIIANHLEWKKQMEKEIGDEAIKNFKDQLVKEIEDKYGKKGKQSGCLGYQGMLMGIESFETEGDRIRDGIITLIKKGEK